MRGRVGRGRGCISGDMTDKPSNMVLTLGSKTSDKEFIPHYIVSKSDCFCINADWRVI